MEGTYEGKTLISVLTELPMEGTYEGKTLSLVND